MQSRALPLLEKVKIPKNNNWYELRAHLNRIWGRLSDNVATTTAAAGLESIIGPMGCYHSSRGTPHVSTPLNILISKRRLKSFFGATFGAIVPEMILVSA